MAQERQGQRPAAEREAERAEGPRRARVLARRTLRLLLAGHDSGRHLPVQQGLERRDLHHPPHRSGDRRDRDRHRRPRRRGPTDALARRQVDRVRAARAFPEHPLPARPGERQQRPALRRSRSRHAGDLGHSRRLSQLRVDARQQAAGVLGRRRHPQARRGQPVGHPDPVPSARRAQHEGGPALPGRSGAGSLRHQDAALDRGLPARRSGRLPDPRTAVDPHPDPGGERHRGARGGPPADRPGRSLRGLSQLLARRPAHRLRGLGRRRARQRARGARGGRRGRGADLAAGPLLRARPVAGRRDPRVPQGRWRLHHLQPLVQGARPLPAGRRSVGSPVRSRRTDPLRQERRRTPLRRRERSRLLHRLRRPGDAQAGEPSHRRPGLRRPRDAGARPERERDPVPRRPGRPPPRLHRAFQRLRPPDDGGVQAVQARTQVRRPADGNG